VTDAAPAGASSAAVEAAVAGAHRREWGRVLAATARVARDLDLAEECVQEAYAAALQGWGRSGIPGNPAAWLTATARRRAIDAPSPAGPRDSSSASPNCASMRSNASCAHQEPGIGHPPMLPRPLPGGQRLTVRTRRGSRPGTR
jgi:Sigma-70 region 2